MWLIGVEPSFRTKGSGGDVSNGGGVVVVVWQSGVVAGLAGGWLAGREDSSVECAITKRDGMSLRIYDIPKDYRDWIGFRQSYQFSEPISSKESEYHDGIG
jgi:hypothetical protein